MITLSRPGSNRIFFAGFTSLLCLDSNSVISIRLKFGQVSPAFGHIFFLQDFGSVWIVRQSETLKNKKQ